MRDSDQPLIVIERHGGFGTFLFGALLGAGMALLFAPRSGEQTREELRTGAMRVRDRAQETVRDLQRSVTDTLDDVRVEVGDRLGAAREAFEAGRQAARETREELAQKIEESRTRVRDETETRRAAVPTSEGPAPDDAASNGSD